MVVIPSAFARVQEELHGVEGPVWLARLPAILDACARRWRLTLGAPMEPLTYNYVIAATRLDGVPVILKACTPTGEFAAECAALRVFGGGGAARLIDCDEELRVLLLERLLPGASLEQETDDAEATRIAAEVMRALWRPLPAVHPFPTVADWGKGFARLRAHFEGGTGPLPPDLVARAEDLFASLLASSLPPVVLHGDLHHGNILEAGGGRWKAIDPKGLAGEPAYETGALLRNPLPALLSWPDPGAILARRIAILAEALDLDPARIHGWALAQAVLSAWWSIEDHGHGWEGAIACAKLLANLSPG